MQTSRKRPYRIGIVIDNPFRDLPGLTLLARELAGRGAETFLIPWNRASQDIWPIQPDLLVMNYLRTNNELYTRQLLAAGIRVVILDTEGSVFSPVPQSANQSAPGRAEGAAGTKDTAEEDTLPAMEEYALTMARDPQIRGAILRYCSWNEHFAEYAVQANWYRRDQIVVTGAPRMDFYAPRWRDAARDIAHYTQAFPDPMVLINGSFPLANPAFQTPEREVNMMIQYFGYTREYVEWWQGMQANALKGITRLANELARRFPKVSFIFRPHPFEGKHIYRFTLDTELDNLHFEKAGTVDGWLLRAKAVIHWGSSTAIEGAVAGIPVLTAGWVPQHLPVPLVDDLSLPSDDAQQLGDRLEKILQGSFEIPELIQQRTAEVVERTYYRIDGASHERAADTIWETLTAPGPELSLEQCRRFAFGQFGEAPLKNRMVARLRMLRGAGVHWSPRRMRVIEPGAIPWDNSDKKFAPEDVERIVRALEKHGKFGGGAAGVERPSELAFGYRAGRSVRISTAAADGKRASA